MHVFVINYTLDPEFDNLFSQNKLNINYVISPEVEVAQAIANNLTIEGAFTAIKFANDKFYLIGVKVTIDTPIVNTPITHANSLYPDLDFAIIGIRRGDDNFITKDKDIIKKGDEVYFFVASHLVGKVMPIFGYSGQNIARVIIVGGGNVGMGLAKILEYQNQCQSIYLIEAQHERALTLAQTLKRTTVISGDVLDSDVLNEATVKGTDTLIAVTDDDKINILGTLLAKRLGARRTMALINRSNFRALASSLGIDALIFPRIITVSKILQFIRERSIKQVYTLGEGFGEVIELEAYHSNFVGLSVGEINAQHHVKIIGILRENEAIIPHKNLVIKNSDNIIIVIDAISQINDKKTHIFFN